MSQPWDSIYIKQSIRFPFLEFLNNHPNYIIMFYNYSKWSEDYQNTKYVMLVVPLTSGSLWPHLHFQSSKGYTHTPRRWRGKSHWTSNWYWQFYGNGQCSALSLLKLVKLHFDLKKLLFIILLVWGDRSRDLRGFVSSPRFLFNTKYIQCLSINTKLQIKLISDCIDHTLSVLMSGMFCMMTVGWQTDRFAVTPFTFYSPSHSQPLNRSDQGPRATRKIKWIFWFL